ncbi:MAG: DUF1016 N-terminal domain-containing protein [Elusimicrobiota bacterium]
MKTPAPVPSTYAALRKTVEETLLLGQERIEKAKILTYWRTGKLIHDHLLKHDNPSEHYGGQVIEKLSADLQVNARLLWRCLQFARSFKILSTWTESTPTHLTWSHYRQLMTIPDEPARLALLKRAEKSQWTVVQLAEKIRLEIRGHVRLPSDGGSTPILQRPPPKLIPRRGEPYTYRLLAAESINEEEPGGLWLDLGFQVRRALPNPAPRFKETQIVESKKEGTAYSAVPSARPVSALFTYYARVERVVDGDTLLVHVDLGFETAVRQYLRLRGIDCPELAAPEGKAAKAFVEKELCKPPRILLTSTRSDKYDRYLADVFYESQGQEKYLNQELLDKGHAGRMEQ